mgnify:FL=1
MRQDLLLELVLSGRPDLVVSFAQPNPELLAAIRKVNAKFDTGPSGLLAACAHEDSDGVLIAISGMAGLAPALKTLELGRPLIMGCKEAMVGGGQLLMHQAKLANQKIRPLDSEHTAAAILIDMAGGSDQIDRLILTGSGGSLRDVSQENQRYIPVTKVLTHPVWRMGPKITVDSATMINKAMEVIAASILFDMHWQNIDVLLDPTAKVHAAAITKQGEALALVNPPDMRIPVSWALGLEIADDSVHTGADAFAIIESLIPLNPAQRSVVELGHQVLELGGTAPMAFVAADEVAVSAFLDGHITVDQIVTLIKKTMDTVGPQAAKRSPLDDLALKSTENGAKLVISGLLEDDFPA